MDKAVEEGKLIYASKALSDGGVQGWWIPKYVADAHPDIKTIDDALKHPELFPDPEDLSKGAVFNGPPGWGGTVVTDSVLQGLRRREGRVSLSWTQVLLPASMVRWPRLMSASKAGWAITGSRPPFSAIRDGEARPRREIRLAEWKRCNTVADCPDPKKNDWELSRSSIRSSPRSSMTKPVRPWTI